MANIMKNENSSGELVIRVTKIRGSCPVYHLGDEIHLQQGYILDPEKSARVCMHSLTSIMPYYTALYHGVKAVELGLAQKDDGIAYVQCLDPCEITGGGTVTFQIELRK